MPYSVNVCNDIEYGLLDSERYMGNGDFWYLANQGNIWNWVDVDSEWAKANKLSSGTLYFMDTDNLKFLYKLPRLLITRNRVRDAMRVIWNLKFKEENGQAGYISEDPNEGSNWSPLTALSKERFQSPYGNPAVSLLEVLSNITDAVMDSLLPGILNLVPWWAYLAAAGYTGIRTRNTLPSKPTFKSVKVETYAYGLGTALLAYRAIKSYQAAKSDEINGTTKRRPRMARRAIVYPQQSLN